MRDFLVSLLWPSINTFYAPNFEKVGDILVSACPYCPYVCVGGGEGIEILS